MGKMICWVAGILILCFACSKPEAKEFVIEGEIKGYGDGIFYVTSETLDDYANDTAFVKNDHFIYRSSTEHPVQLLFLANDNKACYKHRTYSFQVFVENSSVPVRVKAEVEKRIENAEISGSKVQDEFEKIKASGLLDRLRSAKRRVDSLQRVGDTVAYRERSGEFKQVVRECLDQLFALDFAPHSTAAVYTLYCYFPFLSVDELEKNIQRFAPDVESSVYLQKIQDRIRRERLTAIGQEAPDFHLENIDGNQYRLSDFRGKMVLLDFTASWCHWCKLEIPYIEKVCKEMQGKDFEVISVYLDKKREDWVNDVKKSAHPWKCLSDVMAWKKGGMAYDYYVGGIPALIILDKEGRIVSKDTRGEETIQVIREKYN